MKLTHLLVAATSLATVPGLAQVAAPAATANDTSAFDKIWGYTTLYKNKDNSVLQEFSITGRQQNEFYYFDADQGTENDWVNRRTRLGFKARMFQEFTLHVETDLNLEQPKPLYNKLTDAYLKWSPSKSFNVSVGKISAKFTLDGSTSSTALITMDRSQIANNFWFTEEYIPGVNLTGEIDQWIYNAGLYSSGESDKEFGEFNAGCFGVFGLGYNFAKELSADKAILKADLMLQEEDPRNTFTRSNEMVGSLNFTYEAGRFGFGSDLVTSKGYGAQSDMWGLQLMPSYYLNEAKTFQGVFRYTYIDSANNNGIRFARYENSIVGSKARGDEYQEFYAGVNYYLYGHKLKFQTGVQYASMEDRPGDGGKYSGWGVTTGIRVSW